MNELEVDQLAPAVHEGDHMMGDASAPLVLVEYGDFECIYCAQAYHVVKVLQRHYGERLCVVFRHFPLEEVHPHAFLAAEAAEAAAAQSRFWEMHDHLFTHQHALEEADLITAATDLGCSRVAVAEALNDHLFDGHIREDMESGEHSGVTGTPTFFINGHKHRQAYDQHTLIQALDRALGT